MDNDTTTPPDTTSDAAMEASLLAQARAIDAGEPIETTPPAADPQATPVPETTQSGNAPAAKTPQTTPKPATPAPAPDKDAATPPTPYQQKRTDAQRRDDSWKKLNEEKETFRKEREEFYRRQAEQANSGRQPAPKPQTTSADPLAQYTPEQLDKAADEFDRKGNFDLAEEARKAAAAKRAQPPEQPQQQQQQPPPEQTPAFMAAHAEWKANLAAAEKQYPELADPASELTKETQAALRQYPMLRKYPQGITHAVELVQTIREARAAEGLRKEVETLKDRLTKAEARLVPGVGAPETGLKPRSVEQLPEAEAEAAILRMAQAADAGAA